MNRTTEEQFEAAWVELEREQKKTLATETAALTDEVDAELQLLLRSIRESLVDDQSDLRAELDKLVRLAQQFREGVVMWQQKAQTSIKVIEEKQKGLGMLVQEVATRSVTRREQLLQHQAQQAAEVRERCSRILHSVDQP